MSERAARPQMVRPKVRAAQSTTAARTERAERGNLRKSNLEGIAARGVPSEAENISRICQWPLIASHSLFSAGLMKTKRYEKIIARYSDQYAARPI